MKSLHCGINLNWFGGGVIWGSVNINWDQLSSEEAAFKTFAIKFLHSPSHLSDSNMIGLLQRISWKCSQQAFIIAMVLKLLAQLLFFLVLNTDSVAYQPVAYILLKLSWPWNLAIVNGCATFPLELCDHMLNRLAFAGFQQKKRGGHSNDWVHLITTAKKIRNLLPVMWTPPLRTATT